MFNPHTQLTFSLADRPIARSLWEKIHVSLTCHVFQSKCVSSAFLRFVFHLRSLRNLLAYVSSLQQLQQLSESWRNCVRCIVRWMTHYVCREITFYNSLVKSACFAKASCSDFPQFMSYVELCLLPYILIFRLRHCHPRRYHVFFTWRVYKCKVT